ncbi:MAG: hypothetical protein K8W52_11300 [Deltaproteobacteria bacterium]|nr:hypothetical protein [Deltaproteobacteria bacterium]
MNRLVRALRTPHAALFALCFGAYAYFYQAGGWNQNSRFDLTRAIIEDRSLAIDRFVNNTGDRARRDGHYFCDKAPGVSLAGVIPYQVVYALAGDPRPSPGYLAWASWFVTVIVIALPSALGVIFLAFLLRALGLRAGPALGGAAVWGLATLAFPYATLYYGHQLVAALLVIAFAIAVQIRKGITPATPWRLAAIGATGGAAIVVEYPAALAAVAIGVYAAVLLPRRHLLWIVAGGLVPGAILAWYHAAAFGSPTTLPYEFSTMPHRHMGWFMGLGTPQPVALWHILISPFRGLLFGMPWLVLAFPGARAWVRQGARAEVAVSAAVVLLFIWLNASLVDWDGGWAMGARYLVPCLPFAVVLCAGVLAAPLGDTTLARALRAATLAAIAWSAFVMFAGTVVQPEVDGAIRAPLFGYHVPHLLRGEVSTSTQSIDMANHPKVGTRHAWNLGEKLGLPGAASLVPLFAWCIGFGLLVRRRARGATPT